MSVAGKYLAVVFLHVGKVGSTEKKVAKMFLVQSVLIEIKRNILLVVESRNILLP